MRHILLAWSLGCVSLTISILILQALYRFIRLMWWLTVSCENFLATWNCSLIHVHVLSKIKWILNCWMDLVEIDTSTGVHGTSLYSLLWIWLWSLKTKSLFIVTHGYKFLWTTEIFINSFDCIAIWNWNVYFYQKTFVSRSSGCALSKGTSEDISGNSPREKWTNISRTYLLL